MDQTLTLYPLSWQQLIIIAELIALYRTALAQPANAEKLNARIAKLIAESDASVAEAFEACKVGLAAPV